MPNTMPNVMPTILKKLPLVPTLAMIVIIALSNVLAQQQFQINDFLLWSSFTYPLVFLATDYSNALYGAPRARLVVWCGFLVGGFFSLWLSTPRIALASVSAFLASQMLDVYVFDRMRKLRQWWKAPLVSSCLASIIDTLLFFSIAFAATGVPWITLSLGDLGVKLSAALCLLLPFRLLVFHAVRKPR